MINERQRKRRRKKKMDLRELEQIMKKPNVNEKGGGGGGGVIEKKEALICTLNNNHNKSVVDSGSALQLFLDHIPIATIPGINNFPSTSVVVLRTQDYVKDAIRLLYDNNVSGAPLTDIIDPHGHGKHSDPYIGFINFSSMLLWSLKECEVYHRETGKDDGISKTNAKDFFSMLEQVPRVGQTKIGELAKSFLWDPFFPIQLEETLFHVLLLLSKHKLHVVPVTERSSYKVSGFVTELAVIHMLLQSSGLEWFDTIADKAISQFRFENYERVASVYGDKSVAAAMHLLWNSRIDAVAVVHKETERLIGCVRCSDAYLLLDNHDLFINRESINVEQFIHMDTGVEDNDPDIERGLGTLLSAGGLALKNKFIPRMNSPVTNRKTDTLKQAMQKLADTSSSFTFLVDEAQQARGILTLKNIIIQFAPPGMDSRVDGGGFFESALEQTGCNIKDGTIICDRY